MPSLPRTRRRSSVSSCSTLRSAFVLILCTSLISRSTSASVISLWRIQHNAANSVSRTSRGESRRSDGYERIARARQAATSFSEASVNNPSGSPSWRTAVSLSISASTVSNPTWPGSAFNSANRPRREESSSATSASRAATHASGNRSTVRWQNRCSNVDRAEPMMRSNRPGGSIPSARHRTNTACRNRSSRSSTGQTSSANHPASLSSSPRENSRKPNAARTCARCSLIDRERHE